MKKEYQAPKIVKIIAPILLLPNHFNSIGDKEDYARSDGFFEEEDQNLSVPDLWN